MCEFFSITEDDLHYPSLLRRLARSFRKVDTSRALFTRRRRRRRRPAARLPSSPAPRHRLLSPAPRRPSSVADSLSPSDLPRRSFGTCRLVLGLCDFFPIPVSCPARRSLSPSDRLDRSGCTRPRDQPRDVREAVSDLCRLCCRGFAGTLSRSDRIDRICGTNRLSRRKIRLFRRTREYPPTHKTSPCGQTRRIGCIECCSSQALEYPASRSLAPSGQSCRIGCTYRSTKALWRNRRLRYRTQSRRLGCYPDSREPCCVSSLRSTRNVKTKIDSIIDNGFVREYIEYKK